LGSLRGPQSFWGREGQLRLIFFRKRMVPKRPMFQASLLGENNFSEIKSLTGTSHAIREGCPFSGHHSVENLWTIRVEPAESADWKISEVGRSEVLRCIHGLPEVPVRVDFRDPRGCPSLPQLHAHLEPSTVDAIAGRAGVPGLRVGGVLHPWGMAFRGVVAVAAAAACRCSIEVSSSNAQRLEPRPPAPDWAQSGVGALARFHDSGTECFNTKAPSRSWGPFVDVQGGPWISHLPHGPGC
jgi:hypothetical protein